MPPYNPAVASGVHLRAPDSKLDIPHFRGHLPQNKSAGFSGLGCISVLDDFGAGLKFGGHHFQFTHGISISNGAQKLKTAGCSYVLLQYVMSRRGFLMRRRNQPERSPNCGTNSSPSTVLEPQIGKNGDFFIYIKDSLLSKILDLEMGPHACMITINNSFEHFIKQRNYENYSIKKKGAKKHNKSSRKEGN